MKTKRNTLCCCRYLLQKLSLIIDKHNKVLYICSLDSNTKNMVKCNNLLSINYVYNYVHSKETQNTYTNTIIINLYNNINKNIKPSISPTKTYKLNCC